MTEKLELGRPVQLGRQEQHAIISSRVTEPDLYNLYLQVLTWGKNTIPLIEKADRVTPYEKIGEFLIKEIEELKDEWLKLKVWRFKANNYARLPNHEKNANVLQQIYIEGNERITQFQDELTDVFVFYFSIYSKYINNHHERRDEDGRIMAPFDMKGNITAANGQGLDIQILDNLIEMVEKMNDGNIACTLGKFIKEFVSFANHSGVNLDLVESMKRKLAINTKNRDFYLDSKIIDSLTEAELLRVYGYQNIFSKVLRRLYSQSHGTKIYELTDKMKEPFKVLFQDIFMFSGHNYQDDDKDSVESDWMEVENMIEERFYILFPSPSPIIPVL